MSNVVWNRDVKAAMTFLAAAASLVPISILVMVLPEAQWNGPLRAVGSAMFFLPQYAFPVELTGEHGRVGGTFWISLLVWILCAAMFAVATRRLRFRWVVAIALPVVVLCVIAFTTILSNFGYAAVLDGP